MKFRVLLCVALLGWPSIVAAQAPTRGLRAERFEVTLSVLPDGSIDVTETVAFRFTRKTFSEVERVIPGRRTDGLTDVTASMDGQVLSEGRNRGQIRIRRGRDLRVIWRFADTIDRTHTFTLQYRAMGALTRTNNRARLDWQVLPARHRYEIGLARVVIHAPASATRLELPHLNRDGWTFRAEDDAWVAEKQNVRVHESAQLTEVFDATTMAMAPPTWQGQAERAADLAPAFVVAAIILLVSGVGVVGMMAVRYHRPAIDRATILPAEAGSAPAAIATAVRHGRVRVGLPQVLATFVELASRGVLRIKEARTEGAKGKPQFQVVVVNAGSSAVKLRPHEQVVMDVLWLHMKHGALDLKEALRRVTGVMGPFKAALVQEVKDTGLVDAERTWASRGLSASGGFVMALALVAAVLFATWLAPLGGALLLIPAALGVVGLLFIIVGQSFPTLSAHGLVQSERWAARLALLRASAKTPWPVADVETWLPVAVGAGLGPAVVKHSAGSWPAGEATLTWLQEVVSHPSGAR